MDFWGVIIICMIALIIFSMCSWCCKRQKAGGNIYPPVSVQTAAGPVQTPYPVGATAMPMPGATPFNAYFGNIPPGASPYPINNVAAPYPPYPTGGSPSVQLATAYTAPYPPNVTAAPYPPYPTGAGPAPGDLPPSYSQAVSQPPTTEVFLKQPPYNPNF